MEEEGRIMEELQANGYSKEFIMCARKMLRPRNKEKNYMDVVLDDGQVVKWKKPTITIPYKHGDSELIR